MVATLIALALVAAEEPVASVDVVRDRDQWTADYHFTRKSPVWVFSDSIAARETPGSWRTGTWTVATPGVRLERRGWYDALVADTGDVPDHVTVRFEPFTRDIEASYDAALGFTDGSVALYDGKFHLFPAPSKAAVDGYPIDSGEIPAADAATIVTMRDTAGPVLLHGGRVAAAEIDEPGTYVLFGRLDPIAHDAISTLIDPALPTWLASFLTSEIPAVLDRYSAALGPAPGGKPVLMASWNGATAGVRSMGGSVLPSTIVMTFEGDVLNQPSDAVRNGARWFAAHEGAHFWLGQAVGYATPRDGWITEGGADLLAYRAVAAVDPAFDPRKELQQALNGCIASSSKGGVASANERGDHKAYYNCGAVFGLVAERASGGDFAGFVRALIEANAEDRQVTRDEWLAELERRAPGKGLGAAISELLDHRTGNAGPWAALLARAGISYSLDAGGTPQIR